MLKLKYSDFTHEAGCDEAGRGCLAGPVTAAAVILPPDFKSEILNDSKQLSEKKRNTLRKQIEEESLAFAVVHVPPQEIDEINILNASILAMQRALDKLEIEPEFIIIDGNRFKPYKNIAYETIVKGDSKYLSIAAASILAKTYRDELMKDLDEKFPEFEWKKNKGYPTKVHRDAIGIHGPCEHHRMSFKLLPDQLSLDL